MTFLESVTRNASGYFDVSKNFVDIKVYCDRLIYFRWLPWQLALWFNFISVMSGLQTVNDASLLSSEELDWKNKHVTWLSAMHVTFVKNI